MQIRNILLGFLLLSAQSELAQQKTRTLEDYFSQARELEKKEDFATAEQVYRQAVEAFPNQPEIQKRLAILLQTELKLSESVEAFGKVLRNNPQYPEANFFLGLSYLGLNQFQKALESFSRELEASPKYRRARYYKAQALQALDRKIEAAQELDILVKEDPSDARVWYQLGRLYKRLSIHALKQLSNLEPDSVLIFALKAEAYAEDEKYNEAIDLYQQILKKQSDFPGVHMALGEIYWKSGRTEESEKELRFALAEDPNHPMANYYLGEILLRNRKAKDAIPLFQISVAADPKFLVAQFQLGKSYMMEGQLEEALRVLSKVVEAEPESKMVHYQLAQIHARLKNDEKRKYHLAVFEKLNKTERETRLKRSERLNQIEELDRQSPELNPALQPASTSSPPNSH